MAENKIMLLFVDGTHVDFDKPDGFDMMQFIHGMRSVGFVMARGFYVPAGIIKAVIDMSIAEAHYSTAGMPQQNAPTTGKPQ